MTSIETMKSHVKQEIIYMASEVLSPNLLKFHFICSRLWDPKNSHKIEEMF